MNRGGADRWPCLESLLAGYLHQDFVVEHGDAPAAVRAWLAESTPDQAVTLSSEWRSFLNVTSGMDVETRARTLRDIAGGSWAPRDAAEFEAVSALLLDASGLRE